MYDFAAVLSPATESDAANLIATIEEHTGAEIVVYTQYKPGSDGDSTEDDAAALIAEWAIGGADQDGMVVFWNTTRRKCKVGAPGNGQVQLYAAPGFVDRVPNEERQQVFDQDMLPWLRHCDEDNGLLAGLEALDDLLGAGPTATPTATPVISTTGACGDAAFDLTGTSLYTANLTDAILTDAILTGATGTPLLHESATYSNTTCPNGTVQSTTCW